MNCEQKSGVFLNISCTNSPEKTCSKCEKKVCKLHVHRFEKKDLCENCYWEKYLYANEKVNSDYDYHDEGSIITTTSSSPSSNEGSNDGGFDGGFGGGEFGGGGASSGWTEGDAESFNDTTETGGLLNNDDTFFYS